MFLALLGGSSKESPFSPVALLDRFIRNPSSLSLLEMAFQLAAFTENKGEIPPLIPMVEQAAAYLLSQNAPASLHQKLYNSLSTKSLLEPLREAYIKSLPPGPLLNTLAAIPSRNGSRFPQRSNRDTFSNK